VPTTTRLHNLVVLALYGPHRTWTATEGFKGAMSHLASFLSGACTSLSGLLMGALCAVWCPLQSSNNSGCARVASSVLLVCIAGAQEGGSSGPDATLLPLPTQALLSALHDHLTANLAHPSPDPITYSRAAGQVYSAYASGVKQLVAQSGGSHPRNGDHHGIGALIVEALKHVESTVAAATASARQRSSRMLVQA
jgi:hypothetical protein